VSDPWDTAGTEADTPVAAPLPALVQWRFDHLAHAGAFSAGTDSVMSILNYGAESVSVAFEEIKPQEWAEKVYRPDILANPQRLHKKPGYEIVNNSAGKS